MTSSDNPHDDSPGGPSPYDPVRFSLLADIGPNASVRDLAGVLRDLSTTLDLGAKWGMALASAQAERRLWRIAAVEGPRGIVREAQQLEIAESVIDDVEDLFYRNQWPLSRPRLSRSGYPDLSMLIRTIADARVPQVIGNPVAVRSAEYHNPLDLVLTGSGFTISGVLLVLRMARDWGNTRRRGAAGVRQEEAAARRSSAQADYLEWLVAEAKRGRMYVSPGDLLGMMSQSDAVAVQRLGAKEIEIGEPEVETEQRFAD